MGTTIDAVKLVMTSILSTQPWIRDLAVISMPWNSDMEKSTLARALPDGSANKKLPLKLGVFWTDGVVEPQPPIKRGLRIVHDVLKSVGHKVKLTLLMSKEREKEADAVPFQVVDWNPPLQDNAKRIHICAAFHLGCSL